MTFFRALWPSFGHLRLITTLSMAATLANCGDDSPSTYALNVYVSGLTGSGLQVALNGGAPVSISGNSQTTLAHLTNGTVYSVSISAQPLSPPQLCAATNPSGKISGNNADVMITCATATTAVNVSADATLSHTTIASISQVLSADGSGTLYSTVPVILGTAGDEVLLFAVDANGKVISAAMASSGSVTFSADSSALAFARMQLSMLSLSATNAQLDAAIRADSSYTSLLSEVTADFAAGTRAIADPVVAQDLMKIAIDVAQAYPGPRIAGIKAFDPTHAVTLPYPVVKGSSGDAILLLQDGTSQGQLNIINSMPIPWDASTSAAAATVRVPSNGLAAVTVKNEPVTVLITQDSQTLTTIASDFLDAAVEGAFSLVSPTLKYYQTSECVPAALSIATIPLVELVIKNDYTAPSIGEFQNEMFSKVYTTKNLATVVKACATDMPQATVDLVAGYATVLQNEWGEILADLPATGAVTIGLYAKPLLSLGGVLSEQAYADDFWDKTYTIYVCIGGDYSITSCTESLELNPASALMAPGSTISVSISGTDGPNGTGNLTAVPGNLTLNPGNSTVTVGPGQTFSSMTVSAATTIAASPSTSSATVADPITKAIATLPITVVYPTLTPSAANFTVTAAAQTLTVSATGPNGEPMCAMAAVDPCIALPSDIKWSATVSSSSNVVSDTIKGTNITGPSSSWTIPANAVPGTVTISAVDGAGNNYPAITVTVASATNTVSQFAGAYQGTYSQSSGCNQVPNNYYGFFYVPSVAPSENQLLVLNSQELQKLGATLLPGALMLGGVAAPSMFVQNSLSNGGSPVTSTGSAITNAVSFQSTSSYSGLTTLGETLTSVMRVNETDTFTGKSVSSDATVSYSGTFSVSGSFSYSCKIHYQGTLILPF